MDKNISTNSKEKEKDKEIEKNDQIDYKNLITKIDNRVKTKVIP